ncbi:duodenase-1-like [Anabas testudineus]|uniref:Granzyme M n=1 Tax=Anabas testudineus TaxID=64144 RepID=A0A3Q1JU92_ANATE|nr:duodenase-1-like [Anabas testudineus]
MQVLQKILLFHVLTCLGQNGHGSEIIHGEKVPETSMQYMVSVQNDQGHVCGGFLVSENFVVTAAHCGEVETTHVVLGTHNLKNADVKNYRLIEEKFKPKTYENIGKGSDIMLLKLSTKAEIDNSVQTIQLPETGMNMKEGQQCRVAGWGKTYTHGHVTNELRMASVSVISQEVCKYKWSGLPPNVICAGGYGTNKGFCQGDSGGPLVCNGIAVGVVSFNKYMNCNYPDVPNVYTEISKYVYWINSIIKHQE